VASCSTEEHMLSDVRVRRERHRLADDSQVKRTSEAMSGRSLRGTKPAGVGACSAWRASVGARASVIAPRGALLARGGTSGYERSQGVVDGWPAIAWRSSPASRCGAPGGRAGTASGLGVMLPPGARHDDGVERCPNLGQGALSCMAGALSSAATWVRLSPDPWNARHTRPLATHLERRE
jgi:hypothetical protein